MKSSVFSLTILCAALLPSAMSVRAEQERIITAGGGITEIMYALGLGGLLVGVDSSSVYPEAATRLPQVGYERMLSPEGLLSLRPTRLITSENAGPDVALAHLKSAGVEIYLLDTDYTPAAAVGRIEAVASLFGAEDSAKPVVAKLIADLQKAQNAVTRLESRPSVLFIYSRSGGILNVSGVNTAASAMIELAGGRNAVTGYEGYKPLTSEAAVSAQPDVILMTTRGIEDAGGIDGVLAHPGLTLTPAARNRRVIAMDDLYLLGFGPRLGKAVLDLCEELYPAKTPIVVARP